MILQPLRSVSSGDEELDRQIGVSESPLEFSCGDKKNATIPQYKNV